MGNVRDALEKFTGSWAFPALFTLLSFAGWISSFPWPFALVECLLCFLPIFTDKGRAYQVPPILFLPLMRSNLSFREIPAYAYLFILCYLFSLIAYIRVHRTPFNPPKAFLSFLLLFLSFLVSIIASIIATGNYVYSAMFFVIAMILLLVFSVLNCSVMQDDRKSFTTLAVAIAFLSFLISLEVFSFYVQNPSLLFGETFDIGWSNAKSMLTTILTISLPFFGVLIYRKRWESLLAFPMLVASFLLATKSGLLALVVGFIPLSVLAFRSYGKAYQYISLGVCCIFATTFALLLAYAENFRLPFVEAVQSMNLMQSDNAPFYRFGIDGFARSPTLGPSAQGLLENFGPAPTLEGTITPLRNTLVTTLYMGGAIGLLLWLSCEATSYTSAFLRKSPDKWFFLFFLLMTDLIGITDNTIYNLYFLGIYLLALSSFENASLYDRVKVKDAYYEKTTTAGF